MPKVKPDGRIYKVTVHNWYGYELITKDGQSLRMVLHGSGRYSTIPKRYSNHGSVVHIRASRGSYGAASTWVDTYSLVKDSEIKEIEKDWPKELAVMVRRQAPRGFVDTSGKTRYLVPGIKSPKNGEIVVLKAGTGRDLGLWTIQN